MAFQRTAVAASVVFLLPAATLAQSGTSTIAGSVTDFTAGALPGVAVRVVNEDTGVAVETFTNEEGLRSGRPTSARSRARGRRGRCSWERG